MSKLSGSATAWGVVCAHVCVVMWYVTHVMWVVTQTKVTWHTGASTIRHLCVPLLSYPVCRRHTQ